MCYKRFESCRFIMSHTFDTEGTKISLNTFVEFVVKKNVFWAIPRFLILHLELYEVWNLGCSTCLKLLTQSKLKWLKTRCHTLLIHSDVFVDISNVRLSVIRGLNLVGLLCVILLTHRKLRDL